MTSFEHIYGCLAGLALGDALGMPGEFMTPQQIASELGWVDHLLPAPAFHPHVKLCVGQTTDDTGQALAMIRAMDMNGKVTAERVAKELVKWADDTGENLELIIGPSTRQALAELRRGADPRQTGRGGKTNGAAYRAVPIALANLNEPGNLLEQVAQACLPTHGTTVAISGAAAVAFAVAAAVEEWATLESILMAACQGAVQGRAYGVWAWSTPLEKRIELACELARRGPDVQTVLNGLYGYVGTDLLVAESIAAAFGIVCLADGDPMKAVVYGANIGGDTDTIAAIAGAVCGAWRGIEGIDAAILAEVESINGLDLAREARQLEAYG